MAAELHVHPSRYGARWLVDLSDRIHGNALGHAIAVAVDALGSWLSRCL